MSWVGSSFLERADYSNAEVWFQRSLDAADDTKPNEAALSWHQLASIDLNRGEYEEARQKLETALEMRQQIDDRVGEAATLHNLASIDLERGEYEKARKKFETALGIWQRIGNRAGKAMTFANLGVMASRRGHVEEGLRLVALSATILGSIGHADLKEVAPWVNGFASQLQYTQEQLEAMRQEVAESYRRDQGRGLIDAAFGED